MAEVVARKNFAIEDNKTGHSVNIKRGDTGEVLAKRAGKPYVVLINGKTVSIQDRRMLRYLFKVK